ncbi:hypothetical protein COOONC_15110 [Cooperia oncophora]
MLTDAIDVSEMKQEDDEEDTAEIRKWKQAQAERELRRKERLMHKESKNKWNEKPGSSTAAIDSDDEQRLREAEGAGYLNDPEAKKKTGQNLDHLRNQSKTQIEQGK